MPHSFFYPFRQHPQKTIIVWDFYVLPKHLQYVGIDLKPYSITGGYINR